MRQKIKIKNLKYSFFRLDKERDIQVFKNGGWHFNNIMTPKDISNKLKTLSYVYGKYERVFSTTPGKKLFALAILESVRFNDGNLTEIQQVIDKTQKIIRNQLT